VFENNFLRKIFELGREDVTGEQDKLYTGEFHVSVMRSRRMSWTGYVNPLGN
jgi:hypothetical protein